MCRRHSLYLSLYLILIVLLIQFLLCFHLFFLLQRYADQDHTTNTVPTAGNTTFEQEENLLAEGKYFKTFRLLL